MRPWMMAASLAVSFAWFSAAQAAGVAVHEANKDQRQAALKAFQDADKLYDTKRYEEALTAFRASYDIVASPNSRLMIGRALKELGRLDEAYQELLGTIADAEAAAAKDAKYADTAKAARDEMAGIEARVAVLTIRLVGAPEGANVSVGGKPVASLDRPVVVQPGAVVIVAAAPGRSEARRELELAAGSKSEVELELAPAAAASELPPPPVGPEPEPATATLDSSTPLRTWAYVAGGVGVLGLATFGVFGALNNSKFKDIESGCPDDRCAEDRSDEIDSGRRYQMIANVGLIAGVVGLGAGATLFILSSGGEERQASRRDRPAKALWLGVSPGSVELGGRF
jgi:hypothetical protein